MAGKQRAKLPEAMKAPCEESTAPTAAMAETRSARKRPSRSSASSALVIVSRAWLSLRKDSARVDIQWTGRPTCLAATSSATYSA